MNRSRENHTRPLVDRAPQLRTSLLVAASLLLVSTASYAEWEITPVIKVGGEVDDNATVDPRTDQEVRLSGILADLSADLAYSSDLTTFSVRPTFLLRSYSDNPEYESNDIFLRSILRHQMRNSAFGFRVNYDEQQVRTAERSDVDLDLQDPDEIDENDSGRVLLTGDRQKLRFVPTWDYNFSNVSSFGVRVDYYDVSYDNVLANGLTDYTDSRLGLTYRRAVSDRTTFVATATGRRYEADDPLVEDVNGISGQIGIDREMSQTTRLRANIGVENTEQTVGSKEPEVIGDITLIQNLETISMFAQYRRAVSASGVGQVSVRDQISINFSRRLNEKISAGLGVRAYQTRNIGQVTSPFNEREYVQLRSSFTWFLSPAFSLQADYRYTVIDRGPALDGRANSNRINLWFVYEGNTGNR
jgi:hypothetical protein